MKHLFTFCLSLSVASLFAQSPVQVQFDSWENADWTASSRVSYTLNADASVASSVRETFDDPDWENSMRSEFTYDAAGSELTIVMKDWNGPLMEWENSYSIEKTYDTDNRLETTTGQSWELGQWENSSFVTCTYSAVTGYLSSRLHQYWNGNGDLVNETRLDYLYDGDGNVSEESVFGWDAGSSDWSPMARANYTYTAFGEVSTALEETYSDGVWINSGRVSYTYNADELCSSKTFEVWDADDEAWENYMRYVYTYHPNGSFEMYIVQVFDPAASEWENYTRATYLYEDELGVGKQLEANVSIFPNPATDQLNVSFENPAEIRLTVTNLSGKFLLSKTASGALHSLDVKELPAGVYLLHVVAEGKTTVRKFVKS